MRGSKVVGPLIRPQHEGLGDIAAQARSAVAAYVDRHPEHKSKAYLAANVLGGGAGIARGGYHMAKGLVDTGVLVGRLVNPTQDLMAGRTPASVEALELGGRLGRYIADRVADPRRAANDITSAVSSAKVALLPGASPAAATTSDELVRRFKIGMNQGEVVANVASIAAGGPLAKTVGRAGEALALKSDSSARYIAQGYTGGAAEHLAAPYKMGMGAHYIPRRSNPPSWFRDSPFNVLAPPGISRGREYELHAVTDLNFNGAGLPKSFPDKGWSFKRSGLKKYGPLGRAWYGAPGPLKARVGGIGSSVGSAVYTAEEGLD